MGRKMKIAAIITGTIVAVLGVCYLYFIYAPEPREPRLSSTIIHGKMISDKVERDYIAYIPKNLSERPALIVALHGTDMNMEKMRVWTGYELDRLADQYGYIVLYPNGYKGNWNDIRKNSPFPAKKENIDDVGFIQQLVDSFVKSNQVDLSKIFAFGFSNGGEMAQRLAMEKPDLINAICAVSANLPTTDTYENNISQEGATSRIMLVIGTKDPICPYQGGVVSLLGLKKIGTCISAAASAETYTKRNGITGSPDEMKGPNGSSAVSRSVESKRWNKSGDAYVELFSVIGGGHVIPQPVYMFPRILGKTVRDFNSIEQAIEFFHLKYSR
jgi:polyhydroxybutyrate depolymerase